MSAPHAVMPARNHSSLSISIVTYQADYDALEKTLQSLISAAAQAKQRQWVQTLELQLIDNGPQIADQARMTRLAAREQANALWDQVRLFTGHGNVGYGMGHNLGIRESTCVFHLILNPDVVLQVDALEQAISYMEQHEEAAIVVPAVYSEQGEREYLCKAYPSVLDLLIRGFAPSWMKPWFAARLARYEMHHVVAANEVAPVPLGSGAFMFCRTSVLQAVGGFREAFFMYFEDFDLSLRIAPAHKVMYVPAVRIIHFGGDAAKKGRRHVGMFIRSAVTFFSHHGWKWF